MEHSHKERGVVKGIREDYSDKSKVNIEVELPAVKSSTKKKGPKGMAVPVSDYKPTRSVCVSPEMAAEFAIGDGCEVETTVRHFGKRARTSGEHEQPAEAKAGKGD